MYSSNRHCAPYLTSSNYYLISSNSACCCESSKQSYDINYASQYLSRKRGSFQWVKAAKENLQYINCIKRNRSHHFSARCDKSDPQKLTKLKKLTNGNWTFSSRSTGFDLQTPFPLCRSFLFDLLHFVLFLFLFYR